MMAQRLSCGLLLIVAASLCTAPCLSQTEEDSLAEALDRMIVPLSRYVSIGLETARAGQHANTLIDKEEVEGLVVRFDRSLLPPKSGPQFIKIVTTVWSKENQLVDNVSQFAFTFPRADSQEEDEELMSDYAHEILQFGFMTPGRCDSVQIVVDTLPDWGRIRVEVMPDEEYTKYTTRTGARMVWNLTIRGGTLENRFTIGVPKVLYDSRSQDTITYGNVSALLRFHYRNRTTGVLFPVSAGFGVYGVSTPIDVTDRGGGFLFSVYFNLIQFLRNNGYEVTDRANAGIEFAPFFPVNHRSRFIVSARIGYTP